MKEFFEIEPAFNPDARVIVCEGDTLTQLRVLPDNAFRLVVSSPPYNLGKAYEKQVRLQTYLDWQTDIIREMQRVTAENGSIIWQVGNFIDKSEVFPLVFISTRSSSHSGCSLETGLSGILTTVFMHPTAFQGVTKFCSGLQKPNNNCLILTLCVFLQNILENCITKVRKQASRAGILWERTQPITRHCFAMNGTQD